MKAKIGMVSLGCAKNLVDSEVMLGLLKEEGYFITDRKDEADVLIINTCGFINSAKEESINTILEMAQYKKNGRCKSLIVAGCLGQKYHEELMAELPEIDGIIGTGDINAIIPVIESSLKGERKIFVTGPKFLYNHSLPRLRSTPSYYAYIKIAEGCNNCCSYCVIPELRGPYRSRTMESIIDEAKNLAGQGVKEILLIAQDTTSYGYDLYGKYRLAELLEKLSVIEGIKWIRLLYAYPTHFTEELINVIASYPKICKYIDLPLQHGDNDILAKMNRRGTVEDIKNLIKKIREKIPDITLRTTFIVGFPGEAEEHFQNLIDFVKDVRFERVGVFTYSQEEDTPAGHMKDQIPEDVKIERELRLMTIQQKISLEKNLSKIGKTVTVLVDGTYAENPEYYIGRTEGDAPEIDGQVIFKGSNLEPGDFVQVKITGASEYDLMGEVD